MYRMKRIAFLFLVAAFVLGACAPAAPTEAPAAPADTAAPAPAGP